MPIRVQCGQCGAAFLAPQEARGRVTACPKCRGEIRVPQVSPTVVRTDNGDPLKTANAIEKTQATPNTVRLSYYRKRAGQNKNVWIAVSCAAAALILISVLIAIAVSPSSPEADTAPKNGTLDAPQAEPDDLEHWSEAKVAKLTFQLTEKIPKPIPPGFRNYDPEFFKEDLERVLRESGNSYIERMDPYEWDRRYGYFAVAKRNPRQLNVVLFLYRDSITHWPTDKTFQLDIREVRYWHGKREIQQTESTRAPAAIDLELACQIDEGGAFNGKLSGRFFVLADEDILFEFSEVPCKLERYQEGPGQPFELMEP